MFLVYEVGHDFFVWSEAGAPTHHACICDPYPTCVSMISTPLLPCSRAGCAEGAAHLRARLGHVPLHQGQARVDGAAHAAAGAPASIQRSADTSLSHPRLASGFTRVCTGLAALRPASSVLELHGADDGAAGEPSSSEHARRGHIEQQMTKLRGKRKKPDGILRVVCMCMCVCVRVRVCARACACIFITVARSTPLTFVLLPGKDAAFSNSMIQHPATEYPPGSSHGATQRMFSFNHACSFLSRMFLFHPTVVLTCHIVALSRHRPGDVWGRRRYNARSFLAGGHRARNVAALSPPLE
jgi:hypothetical protein